MKYLDFAEGYKTIAGAIVFVLGYFGHQIELGMVMDAITGIMTAVGAIISAYGLIIKVIRKIKESVQEKGAM